MKTTKNIFKLSAIAAAILMSQAAMAQTTVTAQDAMATQTTTTTAGADGTAVQTTTTTMVDGAPMVATGEMEVTSENLANWHNSAVYFGSAIGRAKADFDGADISRRFLRTPATAINGFATDEKDTGAKLFIGKNINRWLAAEATYIDHGDHGYSLADNAGRSVVTNLNYRGFNADLIAKLPMSERFALFARAGMGYIKAKSTSTGNMVGAIIPAEHEDAKWKPHFGVGAEIGLTQKLSLRLEAERNRYNHFGESKGNIDLYSIGLAYKLGHPVATPVYVPAPAPAPVAAAPAPAAEPAPVAVSEKMSFAAEALFDFDKAIVKPEGKRALDELLSKLEGMNTDVMVTVGHADAIGTDDYNQKLSLRRAEAVKAYLVSKGIEQSRVYTEGKGESQPVADNSTSAGRAKNRRVTVEVVGTRK